MEFVGPLLNVLIGNLAASAAWRMVPSFCVKNTGQVSLRRWQIAYWKEEMVCRAKDNMDALRMAAFSRSIKPRLATAT